LDAIQQNNGMGHAVLGHLQLLGGNYDEALATCTEGVELRSSCPLAHGLLGLVQNYCGDPRAAVSHLREALLLEKIYPAWLINFLATAYRDCGDIDLSIAAAKEAQRLKPQILDSQLILCSDYQLGDDHEQASNTAEKIKANNPSFNLASYAANQPYKDSAPLDRVIEALRKAGLPE
jgi:adenylate cyclase